MCLAKGTHQNLRSFIVKKTKLNGMYMKSSHNVVDILLPNYLMYWLQITNEGGAK